MNNLSCEKNTTTQNESENNQNISKEQLRSLVKRLAEHINSIDIKKISSYQSNTSELGSRLGTGSLAIILSIAAAIAYGVLHDSITARLCIEYFNSPAHPNHYEAMKKMGFEKPEEETSPTKIALLWGTIATWWVGAILGTGIAISSQCYSGLPALTITDLIKPIGILLAVMLGGSFVAGITGYILSAKNIIYFPSAREYLTKSQQDLYAAVGFSHNAAYMIGEFGGLCLILWILKERIFLTRDIADQKFINLATSLLEEISTCSTQQAYSTLQEKILQGF